MKIKCTKPRVNSYDFMRYLCASLVKKGKMIIDMDSIIPNIHTFKRQNTNAGYIFDDIEFRTNIDSVISNDISEGINYLQTVGLIGKFNPKYEKLVIYLTNDEADEILSECDIEVSDTMQRLAECFG